MKIFCTRCGEQKEDKRHFCTVCGYRDPAVVLEQLCTESTPKLVRDNKEFLAILKSLT